MFYTYENLDFSEHAQKLARDALVRLASLFPRICILCYATSCTGQIHAWPASLHARLNIIDTAMVDHALGIEQHSHHYKVAHRYAYVLQRHLSEVESMSFKLSISKLNILYIRKLGFFMMRKKCVQDRDADLDVCSTQRFLASSSLIEESSTIRFVGYEICCGVTKLFHFFIL